MKSEDTRTSEQRPEKQVSRRGFLRLAGSTTSLVLLAACGGAAGPAAPAAPSGASQASAPAAPAAPAAAPAVASGGGPKGRVVYCWYTTISPSWLDPQENPPQATPYNFQYALHDALVKPMPGQAIAPSLAESYEMAPDFKSATFKLRQGIKFHDGTPVTPEDVKFTFEKYRGANASILHDKTASIESPDDRTVKFMFKEPFLDFMVLYGTPASGSGWIVPKAYYEKVGPAGYKTNPIGAGPFKFVKQQPGVEIELEAFSDYWRKAPNVKTLVIKGVPEAATRLALLQTGEADIMGQVPGELLDTVRQDSKLQLAPTKSGSVWLDFPGFTEPSSPFHDIRVRQAISLALDRQAMSDAEMGGLAAKEGNWIPEDWPGAISRPTPEFDVAKAKELMAAAGQANGFEIEQLTPMAPYFSIGERIVTQLRAINIRTKVNQMEKAAYYDRLAPGPNRLQGIIVLFSGAPGDAAGRIRENVVCQGSFSGTCLPEIDDRMKGYDASSDPKQRQKLIEEVQNYILDNYVLVPVLRQSLTFAMGPRIANKIKEIVGAIPQYNFPGPYEDLQLKEG